VSRNEEDLREIIAIPEPRPIAEAGYYPRSSASLALRRASISSALSDPRLNGEMIQ
jgi:hypothetical protein